MTRFEILLISDFQRENIFFKLLVILTYLYLDLQHNWLNQTYIIKYPFISLPLYIQVAYKRPCSTKQINKFK